MQKLVAFALTLGFVTLSCSAHAQHSLAERAACQQEAFRLCTHAIPDRDRVRACLRQNMSRLNSLCRGALQRSRK
jgi:hypothetical protein